jgi:transposase
MTFPNDLVSWSREDLLAWVAALQRQIAAWCAEIAQRNRGGKRQAAPVAQGTRVAEPKPPGRTPGSGTFRSREAPPPEAISAPPVDVRVPLEACPAWGGPLAEERVALAYTTALPRLPRPPVTPSRVWGCRGPGCGTQGRGPHPDLAPDHDGAPAHRLGARVRAAAQTLPSGGGIPRRQVPAVLSAWPGVPLPQGALTPDALPQAEGPLGAA